jgi:radical SAM protein with 4Fe4S-binding SPASM domain
MIAPPTTLIAYVTARCTQRCRFCTAGSQALAADDLTPEVVAHALERLPSINAVCFAGLGEPLLAKGLPAMVDSVLASGRHASIITNGHLVASRLDEIPWERLLYVGVSVNETDRGAYAALTGVDALRTVEDAIDLLLVRGAPVMVSFTVSRQTACRMPLFVAWAAERDVRRVAIVNRLPRLDARGDVVDDGFWDEVILEDDRAAAAAIVEARSVAQRLGVDLRAVPVPISRSGPPVPTRCRSMYESIGIDAEGAVSVCQRLLAPSHGVGNVLRDGARPWTSSQVEALRRAHETGIDLPARCRACFGAWA